QNSTVLQLPHRYIFAKSRMYTKLLSYLLAVLAMASAASAAYTVQQQDEVINDLIQEVMPFISVDMECVRQAGISSLSCIINSIYGCALSNGFDPVRMANCFATNCGGNAIKLISCIKI
ncbi:hypothetical protein BOX15_Mlig029556g2, partial [Macrostomum lignano]